MKVGIVAAVALVGQMCGCASQGGPTTTRVGAPAVEVDPTILAPAPSRPAAIPALPDRITLPASYRLVLLDGHMTLVRETDPEELGPAPTSMRIVAGEISRGELAYQPALLPQELAAEVASNRESTARMDDALESVMARSRELAEQAKLAEAQSERLASLLAAAEGRLHETVSGAKAKPAAAPAELDDVR